MDIEDYFDFLGEDDIRVKGTRIGIETVLEDYFDGISPEEIAVRYTSLSLEHVYATITLYLHDRKKLDNYLDAYRLYSEESHQEQKQNPSPVIKRLLYLKSIRPIQPITLSQ